MSLVKAKELRELSQDELVLRLARLRKERYELLQKKEVGQLDRPHRFAHIRREIGQILTVSNEKARGTEKAPAKAAAKAPAKTAVKAKAAAKVKK